MLNRKLSNYFLYIVILLIVIIIYLIRSVMLGNLEEKIDDLDRENAVLQTQIVELEQIVEENRYVDQSFLYELYREVPDAYNETQLVYDTNALLELAGISLDAMTLRTSSINPEVSIPESSPISSLASDYKVVEIAVFFSSDDLSKIQAFIEVLEETNQLYILNTLNYSYPFEGESVPIQLSYYAFFAAEE